MHNPSVVLFIFKFTLSACLATVIAWDPGSHDHYVEGESHWGDLEGNGRPMSADVSEDDDQVDPIGTLNEYLLYTRSNPHNPDSLIYNDEKSIQNSNLRLNQPVEFIAHGWTNNRDSNVNTFIKGAHLDTSDINVIVIDWGFAASLSYTKSAEAAVSVGEHAGYFISWFLGVTGISPSNVSLVGHSLGAHVIGKAGRVVNGTLAKATGLDPAAPMWTNNPERFNSSAAQYTEMIITDGGFLGFYNPLGHANFYPNGGRSAQPGCWFNPCSHYYAYALYAASICYDRFAGKKCENLDEVKYNNCTGEEMMMGNSDLRKSGRGLYRLTTVEDWPFLETNQYASEAKRFCYRGPRRGRAAQHHDYGFAKPKHERRAKRMRFKEDHSQHVSYKSALADSLDIPLPSQGRL